MMVFKHLIFVVFAIFFSRYLHYFLQDIKPELIEGKKVIITGASQNIGEQLAYEFCKLKAHVFLTSRRASVLEKVKHECLKLGALSCDYETADMSDLSQAKKVIEKSIQFLGGIDFLVLNHIMRTLTLEWTNSEENLRYLDESIKVNYLSYIHLSSAAHQYLTKSSGHLVVVSSMAGELDTLNTTAYGATKAALNRFYDNYRLEMFAHNRENYSITNCLLGLIATKSDYSKTRKLKVSAYPINDTAVEIIKAATWRLEEVYIPSFGKLVRYLRFFVPNRLFQTIFLKFTYNI